MYAVVVQRPLLNIKTLQSIQDSETYSTRLQEKYSLIKDMYIIYQLALLYNELREKEIHHGLLISTSVYIDLHTYRVSLGSFAFSRNSNTSKERGGYLKNLNYLNWQERDQVMLKEFTAKVNSSIHGGLIPDYTSFPQWAEKLRVMVSKEAEALVAQMIDEGKCIEAVDEINEKLKLHQAAQKEEIKDISILEYKKLRMNSNFNQVNQEVVQNLIRRHTIREILDFIREDFDPNLLFWLLNDFCDQGNYVTFHQVTEEFLDNIRKIKSDYLYLFYLQHLINFTRILPDDINLNPSNQLSVHYKLIIN